LTWGVYEGKILLSRTIKEPEVSHFHGSGALTFDCAVNNSNSGSVVYVDWCCWLWVPHFLQGEPDDFGLLGIVK